MHYSPLYRPVTTAMEAEYFIQEASRVDKMKEKAGEGEGKTNRGQKKKWEKIEGLGND